LNDNHELRNVLNKLYLKNYKTIQNYIKNICLFLPHLLKGLLNQTFTQVGQPGTLVAITGLSIDSPELAPASR